MQNGSLKQGKGTAVNGTLISTLKKQPKPKTTSTRKCESCSSTASCPVFSGRQTILDKDPPACYPSSLSSPTLHASGSISSLMSSVSCLQSSLSSVKGSVSSLKSFPTSSALQSSNLSLRSSSPSLRSSSSSQRSSSQRSSSEDDSWGTNSWSSGATCLLRSSIKQHSEEAFRARASSGSKLERTSDSEASYQNFDDCAVRLDGQGKAGHVDMDHRDSEHSLTSSKGTSAASSRSTELEEQIEEKLKFSQFLDEVTCRVLDPEYLQAFGVVRQKESVVTCAQTSPPVSTPHFSAVSSWSSSISDSWTKCTPSGKILETSETLRRKPFMETSSIPYLETDRVRKKHETRSTPPSNIQKKEFSHRILDRNRCSSQISKHSDRAPRPPYCSTSLPAAAVKDVCDNSSLQEQKDDLHNCLTYTTKKLHLLEKQFDSTCQYLETELQQAQEEIEKFTEQLCRIQRSYAALQKINQDLLVRIHQIMKLHEEEINGLSREILVLNNQLIEANITIHKLREDNMEKQSRGQNMGLHSSHSVPTVIIEKVSEKAEPERSCPVTGSSSPQAQGTDFMPSSRTCDRDKVQQRVLYKSSDVCCSDTALYSARRIPSCHSTSYHMPCLTSTSGPRGCTDRKAELTDRWKQMSVEDLKTFSLHSSGHVSPYSCSEHHFAANPKIKLDSVYSSSFQDRDDTHVLNPCFPILAGSSLVLKPKSLKTHLTGFEAEKGLVFQFKDGAQVSKSRFPLSGNSQDEQQTEDENESPGHLKMTPQRQRCGNTVISRKDSLTKAQLYGTLLN